METWRTGALANEELLVLRPADVGRRGGVVAKPASAGGCAALVSSVGVYAAGGTAAGTNATLERFAVAPP